MMSFTKSLTSWMTGNDEDKLPPASVLAADEDACLTCSDPCEEHRQYPDSVHIDTERTILGSAKVYGRHVLISTGVSDWPKKIEREPESLAAEIQERRPREQSWRTLITNTSKISALSNVPLGHDVLVLPDNIIVSNVTLANAQAFCDAILTRPLTRSHMSNDDDLSASIGDMKVHPNPNANLILICSHKKRDRRCGVTAPILAKEFDHVLRDNGIEEGGGNGAEVLMVSHIGGHKFAGNVICYTHQGTRGIWYGRVKPCHCEAIVQQTLLEGKVIKTIYRGSMDHSFDSVPLKSTTW